MLHSATCAHHLWPHMAVYRLPACLPEQVFDRRPHPPGPDAKYGAYCRLEPNGLRAAAAIHPRLRSLILRHGLRARPVLIHDTDGAPTRTSYFMCVHQLHDGCLSCSGCDCPPHSFNLCALHLYHGWKQPLQARRAPSSQR